MELLIGKIVGIGQILHWMIEARIQFPKKFNDRAGIVDNNILGAFYIFTSYPNYQNPQL